MRTMMTSIRFMLLWVMGSVFAMAITSIASVLLVLLFSGLAVWIWANGARIPTPVEALIYNAALFSTMGLVMGLLFGSIQSALMRQKAQEPFRGWVLFTVIGSIIGINLTAFVMASQLMPYIVDKVLPPRHLLVLFSLEMTIIPLACISFLQLFSLWNYVRGAWTWVLANIVGGIVLVSLLVAGLSTTATGLGTLIGIASLLFMCAAPGIVTGFTMLWLLQFNSRY